MYTKDFKQLLAYPGGRENIAFTIPQSVESIYNAAIGKNQYLKHLIIPSTIKSTAGLGYLSTMETITIFRCGQSQLIDAGCDETHPLCCVDSNTAVYIMHTKYEYALSEDSSTLDVFPMACSRGHTHISFNGSKLQGNQNLKTINLHPGIISMNVDEFSNCANLKTINFLKNQNCTKEKSKIQILHTLLLLITLFLVKKDI